MHGENLPRDKSESPSAPIASSAQVPHQASALAKGPPPALQAGPKVPLSRTASRALLAVVYAGALVAGWLVFAAAPSSWGLLGGAALAYGAATLFVFGCSVILNNTSVYDPFWSVGPVGLAALFCSQLQLSPLRAGLVVLAASVWGARLTLSFFRGWPGLHHEDFRYQDFRAKTGWLYWPVSLLALQSFPSVLTFSGSVTLWAALGAPHQGLSTWTLLGAGVCLGAAALEELADRQLHQFRLSRPTPGTLLESGVWAWCRHPNYLGEILFWWGLFLMAVDTSVSWRVSLPGPVLITALFVGVSVRLKDTRMLLGRPEYAERMRRVPALIPLPFR